MDLEAVPPVGLAAEQLLGPCLLPLARKPQAVLLLPRMLTLSAAISDLTVPSRGLELGCCAGKVSKDALLLIHWIVFVLTSYTAKIPKVNSTTLAFTRNT